MLKMTVDGAHESERGRGLVTVPLLARLPCCVCVCDGGCEDQEEVVCVTRSSICRVSERQKFHQQRGRREEAQKRKVTKANVSV